MNKIRARKALQKLYPATYKAERIRKKIQAKQRIRELLEKLHAE